MAAMTWSWIEISLLLILAEAMRNPFASIVSSACTAQDCRDETSRVGTHRHPDPLLSVESHKD
jgi:hypothetical protein